MKIRHFKVCVNGVKIDMHDIYGTTNGTLYIVRVFYWRQDKNVNLHIDQY